MLLRLIILLVIIRYSSTNKIHHWSVNTIFKTIPQVNFRLDIYSPTTPGSYSILVFLPGLSGLVPALFYNKLVTIIAEQNVILVGISKIENVKPEKLAVHLGDFLEWIVKSNDGITHLFEEHKSVKGVIPNIEQIGFLTHSSAAHPLGQYLNTTCGPLKLIIMMNPVDGMDPYGIIKDFITHPPNPLPFRTPTLIISDGLDNVPVIKEDPPCAPNKISNDRWYRSLYGPTFLVNLTNYGHADNLDGLYHEASKAMCTSCKGHICNFPQYKIDEATLITSFVHAIFNRDVRQLQVIQNPQLYLKIHVSNKYDLHNYDYKSGGPGGFCTHN